MTDWKAFWDEIASMVGRSAEDQAPGPFAFVLEDSRFGAVFSSSDPATVVEEMGKRALRDALFSGSLANPGRYAIRRVRST